MTATEGRQFDQTLAALYGAAMGAQEWPEALDRLAALTGSRCITLDTYNLDTHVGAVLASNMAPHPALDEYNRTFGKRNILIESAYRSLVPGQAFAASEFVSIDDFVRTDLYNMVYRALGMKFVAGVPLERNGPFIAQVSLIKPEDARDFSRADLRGLENISGHLLQAWAGYCHLQKLSASLDTLTSLWNQFDHAVIVIDSRRRITFSNRAAEAMLTRGVTWHDRNGVLVAADAALQHRFQQLVRAVHRNEHEIARLSLGRAGPGSGILATLFRIGANRLALVMSDPAQSDHDFRAGLKTRFGLTHTEAELVNALLNGQTVREFADLHRIAYETARTHMKNAMGKNGWRKQNELIKDVLMALLPASSFRRSGL